MAASQITYYHSRYNIKKSTLRVRMIACGLAHSLASQNLTSIFSKAIFSISVVVAWQQFFSFQIDVSGSIGFIIQFNVYGSNCIHLTNSIVFLSLIFGITWPCWCPVEPFLGFRCNSFSFFFFFPQFVKTLLLSNWKIQIPRLTV